MQSSVAKRLQGGLAPIGRSLDAWYDSGFALWILLALFVALWTSFQIISYASLDLHPDLVEVFAWSRHPSAGYYKHPPLAALIVAAWFTVLPIADWSFHLLAMLNAALALYVVDLIARRYLAGDKRLLVLLLLLLTPFYQFHGQRFASNQVLLLTWPLATYCFLRAFETRTLTWSVAAGAAAALAMLGKYYSVYLLAGLVAAALMHPQRWNYLRSASPWVSVVTGLVVLAPHLYWLLTTGAQPIDYALNVHGSDPVGLMLYKTGEYAVGSIGYVALPIAVYLLATRPDRRPLAQALWPPDADRRMLVVLLAVPLLLPLFTAPLLGVSLTSLWSMPAWFLLPIVLLAPAEIALTRASAIGVAQLVLIVTLAALAAAPAIAWIRHASANKEGRSYHQVVSVELTRVWRETMRRPLTIVVGDPELVNAVTFYSPDHPDAVPGFNAVLAPWVTNERLAREGFAALCRAEDDDCVAAASKSTAGAPDVVRATYAAVVPFLGIASAPARFVFVLMPPQPPATSHS